MRSTRVAFIDQQRGVRRVLLGSVLVTAAGLLAVTSGVGSVTAADPSASPTVVPAMLVVTPSQPEGPYYPVELPSDRDADLTVIEGVGIAAAGEVLMLEGLVLTTDGTPVEGATVEIWQTDGQGVYLHPSDPGIAGRDETFQGYGESITDAAGTWSFRTILPELYGGRPRHIHAKVKSAGQTVLTTQVYFSGGDISQEGAVELGEASAPLVVEVLKHRDAAGVEVLRAEHVLVIAEPAGG